MQLGSNQGTLKSNYPLQQQTTRWNEHFEMKFSTRNTNQLGVLSQRNFLQLFEMRRKSSTSSSSDPI